jgi:DNA-binding transcriptional MerR regulator
MGDYSIKELEVITGIKAHTIRIWEQRYGILDPGRTATNIRRYKDSELKHLLNISFLNKNGLKISKLAKMKRDDLKTEVLSIYESNPSHANVSEALTLAMMDFDEVEFEALLDENIRRFGFEDAFITIIFPFLYKLGLLWQTDVIKVAQEHFVSNLIRQKLIVGVDGLKAGKGPGLKKFMLFLPENETHELSLLFMNYLARSRKHHTLYLGSNVPYNDIITCYEDYKPDFLFTVITSYPPVDETLNYIENLCRQFAGSGIILTGSRVLAHKSKLPAEARVLENIGAAVEFMNEI